MSLPRVAIVGRPNVGKSSLLNRLARRRVSIVDATPGVTRDRVTTMLEIDPPLETPKGTPGRLVEMVDTGGYGVYTAEGGRYDDIGADLSALTPGIEAQIAAARSSADVVLFLIDAQAGVTALDETVARLLRIEGISQRVIPVANKVDSPSWEAHALEASGLGLGEPICISATTGSGLRRLQDEIWRVLGDPREDNIAPEPEPEMQMAIVGCRNAGKSTLVNALAGEPRVIVSEIAGTTRDAVDVRFEIDGRRLLAIDTAGIRKRKSFANDIEYYASTRMEAAMRRADVVVLLIDATRKVSQIDKKLSLELQKLYKPTVIVVNKRDLIPEDQTTPDEFLEYLTRELRGLDYAPIVFITAKDGEGVRDVAAMAFNLFRQARHRESTANVNRAIERIMKERGPSSRLGKEARMYFASQIDVQPPTIVIKVNRPALFEGQYERYLLNRLRDELPFSEVPIKIVFSPRDRVDMETLRKQGRMRSHAEEKGGGSEMVVDAPSLSFDDEDDDDDALMED